MNEVIYRRLADFLDTLPGGFAPTSGDADLQLLAGLFNESEANLAPFLILEPESAAFIAARAGLPEAEVSQRLAEMADKGLVMSSTAQGEPPRYWALPWVVGIYELQVNNLTPTLRQLMEAYWSSQKRRRSAKTIPQMRVIPVGESIETRLEVMPYEHVETILQAHEHFAVAPCICRRHAKLEGGGCSAPEESCLVFGDWAQFYVRTGRGREIDRAEVRAILKEANEHNRVLEPSNSQDVSFICTCCGCCCGVLQGIKRQLRPADVVANNFVVQLDVDTCTGCRTCLERCQMAALVEDSDRVRLKVERCIGCGLCVTTCPGEALKLVRKPADQAAQIPPDLLATWNTISRQKAGKV
ncbi:MAG: 4Fe-4S dicluster domain-containing protein [Anaerolineae bacterium]